MTIQPKSLLAGALALAITGSLGLGCASKRDAAAIAEPGDRSPAAVPAS